MKKKISILIMAAVLLMGCGNTNQVEQAVPVEEINNEITGQPENIVTEENGRQVRKEEESASSTLVDAIFGEWDNETSAFEINDGIPTFDSNVLILRDTVEYYSDLDDMGRCRMAFSNIDLSLIPTEGKVNLKKIIPSGFNETGFDSLNGDSLYIKCQLISYNLTGDSKNDKNVFTGTRFLKETMSGYEDLIGTYVKNCEGNHVLYRVTPYFFDNELVARGVTLEGWSVEDGGKGVCFYVYCPNAQPGFVIDYSTGIATEN